MPDVTIQPVAKPFTAAITPPGSKSLTNRALVLAALADGPSTLSNVLFADDTLVMIECLIRLGFDVRVDRSQDTVRVQGLAGRIPRDSAALFCGNSGTTIRFLTALCALGYGPFNLDGIPRMRQRPTGDLVALLKNLGVRIDYLMEHGFPPSSSMRTAWPRPSPASAAASRASSSPPSFRSPPTPAMRCRSTSTARRRAGPTSP